MVTTVAALVVGIVASRAASAEATQPPDMESEFRVRLFDPIEATILRKALAGAVRRLRHSQCQTVLSEFRDVGGRPLADTLAGLGIDGPQYLSWIFFRDASARYCEGGRLAVPAPGSRVVFVCGRSFERS
jgi:hypothetical protein